MYLTHGVKRRIGSRGMRQTKVQPPKQEPAVQLFFHTPEICTQMRRVKLTQSEVSSWAWRGF